MTLHWCAKYIGIPYLAGGRTPAGLDCWGLLQLVYRQEFGITLPELPGIAQTPLFTICSTITVASQKDWEEIDKPVDGCAVAMSQKQIVHHVGLWADADGGKIVHSWLGHKVIADTLRMIKLKGIRSWKFYTYGNLSKTQNGLGV